MAYTIVKSNGTVLTSIPDGTINTTSTSLGLPGRNYAGYGQTLDTNFVHLTENFANDTPPANPLQGQLWYNTNANLLYVCPTDGLANANAWISLATAGGNATTTFGTVNVNGNLNANNVVAVNTVQGANGIFTNISVSANANIASSTITSANIATLTTQVITTGATTTAGTMTGTWTLTGGLSGNSLVVANGNIYTTGIRTNNYYYANGTPFAPAGTYNNGNVFDYLTGANSVVRFTGNIAPSFVTTTLLTAGSNVTAGTITGNWTLSTGSRLNATYADLAERFESDTQYDAGTVVQLGGDKEITAVIYELSDDVFGVISDSAAYLMNSAAGSDETHPPVAVGGRVLVKVIGAVKKGERLVSAGSGRARAAKSGEATAFNTIGRALVDKLDTGVGTVEAFVTIR
jgi:hypothetical protein